jgi:hypothetical protein
MCVCASSIAERHHYGPPLLEQAQSRASVIKRHVYRCRTSTPGQTLLQLFAFTLDGALVACKTFYSIQGPGTRGLTHKGRHDTSTGGGSAAEACVHASVSKLQPHTAVMPWRLRKRNTQHAQHAQHAQVLSDSKEAHPLNPATPPPPPAKHASILCASAAPACERALTRCLSHARKHGATGRSKCCCLLDDSCCLLKNTCHAPAATQSPASIEGVARSHKRRHTSAHARTHSHWRRCCCCCCCC